MKLSLQILDYKDEDTLLHRTNDLCLLAALLKFEIQKVDDHHHDSFYFDLDVLTPYEHCQLMNSVIVYCQRNEIAHRLITDF